LIFSNAYFAESMCFFHCTSRCSREFISEYFTDDRSEIQYSHVDISIEATGEKKQHINIRKTDILSCTIHNSQYKKTFGSRRASVKELILSMRFS